jgi:hypothetical protein
VDILFKRLLPDVIEEEQWEGIIRSLTDHTVGEFDTVCGKVAGRSGLLCHCGELVYFVLYSMDTNVGRTGYLTHSYLDWCLRDTPYWPNNGQKLTPHSKRIH